MTKADYVLSFLVVVFFIATVALIWVEAWAKALDAAILFATCVYVIRRNE